MVKVQNTSDQPQHFVGIGTFEPNETKDVSKDTAELLLRSPFISLAETKVKGTAKDRSVKGIERD